MNRKIQLLSILFLGVRSLRFPRSRRKSWFLIKKRAGSEEDREEENFRGNY